MILRRVIAHVRKQEWTAIAIDLVIVVLGVVIGIQVSNWNAARADRERAHGYLERIRDDLDADIAGLENGAACAEIVEVPDTGLRPVPGMQRFCILQKNHPFS